MNNIDFSRTAGFPFTIDILGYLQSFYKEAFDAIVSSIGDNLILSGVENDGVTVTDGYIIYNKELLPFVGGAVTDPLEFVINETITPRMFQSGDEHDIIFERTATLSDGIGAESVPFSDLKRYAVVSTETEVMGGEEKTLFKIGSNSGSFFKGFVASVDASDDRYRIFKLKALSDALYNTVFTIDLAGNIDFNKNIKEKGSDLRDQYLKSITNGEYTGDLFLTPPGSWYGQYSNLSNKPLDFTNPYCLIESFLVNGSDKVIRLTDLTDFTIYKWSIHTDPYWYKTIAEQVSTTPS